MEIIRDILTINKLNQMAQAMFGDMVKAVIDVDREILAVDAELHSDLEALLIKDGSKQKSLWGINFYPSIKGDDFVEFDSLINVRPSQNNKSREINDASIRKKILEIVEKRIKR